MEIREGDWVRTDAGIDGTVVLISRASAFVDVGGAEAATLVSYLLSELTKIDPPESDTKNNPPPPTQP
jgi:hypothetical protein